MTRKEDRLYHLYNAMKQRCYSPINPSYKFYSRKGITVCQEWLDDFNSFREWALANGYDYNKNRKEQSLDRIDNNKGYSPDNCRFVTHSENCRNTSRNVWIEYDGKKQLITDWAKELGVSYKLLSARHKRGLPAKEVLFGEKFSSHKSNTGIKGISFSNNKYTVYLSRKYIGCRKTLEEAIELKERYINANQ